MAVHLSNPPQPPPYTELIHCAISTCDWALHDQPPTMPAGLLAGEFGLGVMSQISLSQHYARREQLLREHLETHSLLEFVTEISQLRNLNIGLVEQMQQLTEIVKISSGLRRDASAVFHQPAPKLGQYPITGG